MADYSLDSITLFYAGLAIWLIISLILLKIKLTIAVRNTLRFASINTFFALLLASYISYSAIGDYNILPIYAMLATFLTACIFWYFIIEKHQKYHIKIGIIVGIATALFSHYVCWYIMLIPSNISYYIFDISSGSLNEPPIDLISGLLYMWVYTLYSWLFFGWISLIIGGMIGGFYSHFLIKNSELSKT